MNGTPSRSASWRPRVVLPFPLALAITTIFRISQIFARMPEKCRFRIASSGRCALPRWWGAAAPAAVRREAPTAERSWAERNVRAGKPHRLTQARHLGLQQRPKAVFDAAESRDRRRTRVRWRQIDLLPRRKAPVGPFAVSGTATRREPAAPAGTGGARRLRPGRLPSSTVGPRSTPPRARPGAP